MTPRDRKPTAESQDDSALDKELAHEDIQQGADQSIAKQEQLKRTVQQHPQRDLPGSKASRRRKHRRASEHRR